MEEAQLTDSGVALLTSSPHLGRVRRLGMARATLGDSKNANKLTDASAVALAEADNLPALTDIDLSGYKKITVAGARAIVESPRRAGLKGLNVSGGACGPGVAELFRGSACQLTGLEELRLNEVKLGDAGAAAIAGDAALSNLRGPVADPEQDWRSGCDQPGRIAVLPRTDRPRPVGEQTDRCRGEGPPRFARLAKRAEAATR